MIGDELGTKQQVTEARHPRERVDLKTAMGGDTHRGFESHTLRSRDSADASVAVKAGDWSRLERILTDAWTIGC
jgi:hypothetical protein